MRIYILLKSAFLASVFIFVFSLASFAQVTLGAGFSGMKYYGQTNQRPIAVGFNANLGIEFSPKTRLVLEPTFFVPVTYSYNQQWNINNVPSVKTDEKFSATELAALFQFDLIGNNKGGGVLYIAAGPSIMMYNTNVTRESISDYNYSGKFNDYMLDARAGFEIPFLVLFKLYGEVEVQPKLFTDFKSNSVNYTPNSSSVMAATIGLRIHI